MSAPDALPQRTPGAAAEQASDAALADEFGGLAGLGWLRDCGANMSDTLIAWDLGQLAEVPVGTAWDVVRTPTPQGWKVVQYLNRLGITMGPVLHHQYGVDFMVQAGSANDWDLPGARVLGADERLQVPPPSVIAPRTQNAHTWIVAPQDKLRMTDACDLYGAYVAAILNDATAKGAQR